MRQEGLCYKSGFCFRVDRGGAVLYDYNVLRRHRLGLFAEVVDG